MRKVLFNVMLSLDGLYAGDGDDIGWHFADDEHTAYAIDFLNSVDTLIFGRKTYQLMAAYWPGATNDPIADSMNRLEKVVFSRTLKDVSWHNSRLATASIPEEIALLKGRPGKHIAILGSADLATSFADLDLIDEYQILLCPLLIGCGRTLFPQLHAQRAMTLRNTRTRQNGVVELTYT